MIIGLNHFGGDTFAGLKKNDRNKWNQMCPAKTEWVPLVKKIAGITRCKDAN